MEKLKSILQEKKQNYPELCSHPNFEKRLKWELIEIEVQDAEDYFINLYESGKKHDFNEHNLLVCKLLDIVKSVDLDREPNTKNGEYPDVDVDYLPIVRDYLKNVWAPEKFGSDKVCNIGNYGTFGLKSTFIDMARVHGLDRTEILNITTSLRLKDDEGEALTFDKALELYPDLKVYCDKHPDVAKAVQKLLHRNRSMGKHAGGLILCNQPIDNFVPLVRGTEGEAVSAWVEGLHGQDLGPVGLIKFDLLVVNSLWQIALTVKMVKERHHIKNISALDNQWDWSDLSYLNDSKCMEMANAGDLKCVFQYDSEGIRKLARKCGIDRFDDMVNLVALYRPGPLNQGMDETYALRKRGKQPYELHPVIEEILGKTYGIMIFQEDVMKILAAVGKIPIRDCYAVIKAISKKKTEAFQKYKDKFIENGQLVLSAAKEEIEKLFEQIYSFSEYGFNKTLTEDTTIYCVDGIKQIKDVCAGDKVFCVNEKGEQAQTEVVAVHDHGIIDVVEVTFDDGYKVKCTLDHKFLTEEGQVPLWKIIKSNLCVLSSPLGEQNAKKNTNKSPMWANICQRKPVCKTSENLRELQSNYFATKNRESQSHFSLRVKASELIKIKRSSQRMSALHLFEMERNRSKTYISLRDRVFAISTFGRTSSSLREVCGNQGEKYQRQDGKTKRLQPCARNKSHIFCNCQENFCSKRCSGSQIGSVKEMERQQSRGVCKVYRKSPAFSEEVQNGNVVKAAPWMEAEKSMLWERQEICGFGQKEDLDRDRWAVPFLANKIDKQQKRTQSKLHAVQRSNTQGGVFEKTGCDTNKIEYDMLPQKNRGTEVGMVSFTPEYSPISNTGSLVPRRVLRVVPVGKQQCYDLEVAVSTHNFILPNGIVTSNSHSVAYSYISARQLYLKAYYPIEFYTATLQCESADEKLRDYITEATNHGVDVCAVDINLSKETFNIVEDKIYIGFSNIKGIGEEKAKKIVELQPYSGFEDFLTRFGTEATVLRALIPLGIFKEAEPEKLYKFWLIFSEYQKMVKDRFKRFELSMSKIADALNEGLPPKLQVVKVASPKNLQILLEHIEMKDYEDKKSYIKVVQDAIKKSLATLKRFSEKAPIKPTLESFNPDEIKIDDAKVLAVLRDARLAQETYYGYPWDNRVKNAKEYEPNKNFNNLKLLDEAGALWATVICEVMEVNVKKFKSGKGSFASISVVDDNFEMGRITIWDDDFQRFKPELKKGNLISIQVCPPSNGFSSYTFKSPPRHKRYELPKDKALDYRLVLLEEKGKDE